MKYQIYWDLNSKNEGLRDIMNELRLIIYNHLNSEIDNLLIANDNVETFEYDVQLFQDAIEKVRERIKVKLKSGKCSEVLIEQLARHQSNLGESFGDKIEFYNVSEICDIIELVENEDLDKVLPERRFFRRDVLVGFLKIHHSSW